MQRHLVGFQGDFILLWQFVELVFVEQFAFGVGVDAARCGCLRLWRCERRVFGHGCIVPPFVAPQRPTDCL